MTTVLPPESMCARCVHLDGTTKVSPIGGKFAYKCTAFPGGIPRKISDGRFDHRSPFEGDQGIQFKPHDAEDTKVVQQAWGPARRPGA